LPFVDVASTPDPLTKKQRFEDSQHFSLDVTRDCSNAKSEIRCGRTLDIFAARS
jgi:hypothetical protein